MVSRTPRTITPTALLVEFKYGVDNDYETRASMKMATASNLHTASTWCFRTLMQHNTMSSLDISMNIYCSSRRIYTTIISFRIFFFFEISLTYGYTRYAFTLIFTIKRRCRCAYRDSRKTSRINEKKTCSRIQVRSNLCSEKSKWATPRAHEPAFCVYRIYIVLLIRNVYPCLRVFQITK